MIVTLYVTHHSPDRLESLLELSARTSAANSDPYKDNLRVALLPYDLIFQVTQAQPDPDIPSLIGVGGTDRRRDRLVDIWTF